MQSNQNVNNAFLKHVYADNIKTHNHIKYEKPHPFLVCDRNEVSCSVEGNCIIVKSDSVFQEQVQNFVFEIFCSGKWVEKIVQKDNVLEYVPKNEGAYRFEVKTVFENKKIRINGYAAVSYFSEKTRNRFDNFLKSNLNTIKTHNKFFEYLKPFQDFCVAVNFDLEPCNFLRTHGFKTENITNECFNNVQIASKTGLTEIDDAKIVLSGQLNTEERFIFGQEDIEPSDTIESFSEKLGGYSCCLLENKRITVATDYFGLDSLFYYTDGTIFLFSNRYQLLLRILSESNQKLTVNEDYISNSLFVLNHVYNDYLMDDNCLFNEIKVLPFAKKVHISADGVSFVNTEVFDVLNSKEELTVEEYNALVYQARDEIIHNIKVVLDSKHFDHFSMDLTGGLDSRLSFAAATNIENANKKIYIHNSNKRDNIEFYVASSLADSFGFNYDIERFGHPKNARGNYRTTYDEQLSLTQSLTMSKLIDPYIFPYIDEHNNPKTITFNGQAVEVCTRTYVTKVLYPERVAASFFDAGILNEKVDWEFIKKYILRSNIHASDYQKYSDYVLKNIQDLPGKSDCEKLENSYLFYRNRYHFSLSKSGGYAANRWTCSASKAAFKAFHLSFGKIGGFQLVFDLMYALNPLVAAFEYGDSNYEEMKKSAYLNSTIIKPTDYAFISHKTDISRYEKQREEYVNSIANETKFDSMEYILNNSKHQNIKDKNIYLKNLAVEDLKIILDKCGGFHNKTGIDLFYYLTEFMNTLPKDQFPVKMKSLYIKINDIAAQLKEIQ